MEFGILGPLEVRSASGMVPIRRGLPRTILIALVLRRGHTVTSDFLVDLLWGDELMTSREVLLVLDTCEHQRSLLISTLGANGGAMNASNPVQIALAIYPNFTMLDIIGPFQVLADVPGHEVVFVAAEAGPVVDHTGRARLIATKSFADVAEPDIVVVPGGLGDTEIQPELVEWLRAVHPTTTWTTASVPARSTSPSPGSSTDSTPRRTGPASVRSQLGAHYTTDRVVERGKVITAAGVSSGIDMALVLLDRMYGSEIAQMIQLAIEYDPQPPFDAGSPAKAPAALVDLVQQRIGEGPALPATTTGGSR